MDIKSIETDFKVAEVELSYKPQIRSKHKIISSDNAYKILLPTFKEGAINYRESFKVLLLNQENRVLGYTDISEGGITNTYVDIRIILQAALLTNSVALILAHNHPSGTLKPSQSDKAITQRIKEAAKIMEIKVLDHIIISDEGYYSFTDEGII